MKPIAYVSDENYLALAGVSGEFESLDSGSVTVAESSARGAFYLNLPTGRYRVTLSREGFGSKWSEVKLDGSAPFQFRLSAIRSTDLCGRSGSAPAKNLRFGHTARNNSSFRSGATD